MRCGELREKGGGGTYRPRAIVAVSQGSRREQAGPAGHSEEKGSSSEHGVQREVPQPHQGWAAARALAAGSPAQVWPVDVRERAGTLALGLCFDVRRVVGFGAATRELLRRRRPRLLCEQR